MTTPKPITEHLADLRERVARAISSARGAKTWQLHADEADAVLAELGLTTAEAAPQPQPQPVAWMDDFGNVFPLAANKGAASWLDDHKRNWKPLYAAPQPQAEPVAYVWPSALEGLRRGNRFVEAMLWPKPTGQAGMPLYAAPQPQAGLLEQHARDSAELRRLCDERDRYRNEARGLRDALTDALENNESLRLAASSAPPRQQASAEPTISEVLAEYERQTKELPCQHEVPERGSCSYNWRMAIIGELRAIANEAERIRASLGVGK